ncbi:MAG: penicillin acylase family protein [Planctomycetota bacterium]|nr:penicillin acylase family protein [Planctomycetota bacterium]
MRWLGVAVALPALSAAALTAAPRSGWGDTDDPRADFQQPPGRQALGSGGSSAFGSRAGWKGPSETVEILRDVYGVPHVYADSIAGAVYGHGWAQAADHLETMLLDYLAADGRLSEAFPDGDERTAAAGFPDPVESDRLAELFRYRSAVDDHWAEIDALDDPVWGVSTSEVLAAFAAGINDYMDAHPGKVPAWWSGEVSAQQVVAWTRLVLLSYQIDEAMGNLPGGGPNGPDGTGGSNAWVLGPSKTTDQSVLVQADPHRPWSGPATWYEAHLTGGGMESAGGGFYGIPILSMAFNRDLALSLTSNGVDNADAFRVTVDPTDPTRYLHGSSSRPFTFEQRVLQRPDGTSVTLDLAWSHHGPVIQPLDTTGFSGETHVYAAGATILEETGAVTQLLGMALARTIEEWKAAASLLQIQRWNMLVGTADGQVYYVHNSRHPDRVDGLNYKHPIDGSDPAVDWTERAPWDFAQLASVLDPATGYVQNCNNSPGWTTSVYGELFDELAWPSHYMRVDKRTMRERLATQEIEALPLFSLEDSRDLSLSNYLLMAEWWVTLVFQVESIHGDDPGIADPQALAAALAELTAWDGRATTDSTATLLFQTFIRKVNTIDGVDVTEPPPPAANIPAAMAVYGLNLLADSWREIEAEHGTGAVPWRDVHRIRRGAVDLPIGGAGYPMAPLRITKAVEFEGSVGYVGQGSSYLRLVRLKQGEPPQAISIKPWGNSDDPTSPHYSDLTELYATDTYKPLFFERADVEANLDPEGSWILTWIP